MTNQKYDITNISGRTVLWIDSERIEDCLSYYRSNNIDSIGVNPVRGYSLKNLDFIKQFSEITELDIVYPPDGPFDLSPIQTLRDLRSLIISGPVALKLEIFPKLEVFRGGWQPKLQLKGCDKLRILDLSGYKPKAKNLDDLPRLPSLRELSLVQSPLINLSGVECFEGLKKVELAYLTKLCSLNNLHQIQGLEVLDCQKCRKLTNHEKVRALKNLKVLRFNDCGEIQDLDFINDIPNLKEFRFVNTNIVNGDLTPLIRLQRVGFFAKKHYSHTPEELDFLLKK